MRKVEGPQAVSRFVVNELAKDIAVKAGAHWRVVNPFADRSNSTEVILDGLNKDKKKEIDFSFVNSELRDKPKAAGAIQKMIISSLFLELFFSFMQITNLPLAFVVPIWLHLEPNQILDSIPDPVKSIFNLSISLILGISMTWLSHFMAQKYAIRVEILRALEDYVTGHQPHPVRNTIINLVHFVSFIPLVERMKNPNTADNDENIL